MGWISSGPADPSVLFAIPFGMISVGGFMLEEFKKFAMRGNVIDLAVGFIMGGAFGGIVSSLVKDVIMPPIGLILGKVDFASLYVDLSGKGYATLADAQKAGAPTINYGLFINTVINFIIVAFVLFLLIRGINKMTIKPAPAAPPVTKECPRCFSAIALKATRCPNCTAEL
jgi:large conductance mechanosensitive channel